MTKTSQGTLPHAATRAYALYIGVKRKVLNRHQGHEVIAVVLCAEPMTTAALDDAGKTSVRVVHVSQRPRSFERHVVARQELVVAIRGPETVTVGVVVVVIATISATTTTTATSPSSSSTTARTVKVLRHHRQLADGLRQSLLFNHRQVASVLPTTHSPFAPLRVLLLAQGLLVRVVVPMRESKGLQFGTVGVVGAMPATTNAANQSSSAKGTSPGKKSRIAQPRDSTHIHTDNTHR